MDRRLLFAFQFVALFVLSCSSKKECDLHYKEFPPHSSTPYIFITGIDSNCSYSYSATFWINRKERPFSGILYKDDKSIQLQINPITKSKVTYFDFTRGIGEDYPIRIVFRIDSANFIGRIDQIFSLKDGSQVFMFRIVDGFSVQEIESDLVFFVTKEDGIIGSYISDTENGEELVVQARGDILRSTIDYSKKRFMVIE